MSKTGFFIEEDLCSLQGAYLQCPKCGRKIFVQIALCGTCHNESIQAACAECVSMHGEFSAEHPEIAKEFEEWKKS